MSLFSEIKIMIDEPGEGVFWTDSQVYDAANEAMLEMWAVGKYQISTATLTATAGADLIDLPCTLMIPQYFVGTGGKYFMTTHAQTENWLREWKLQARGYPKHLILWDTEHVRPVPSPDQTYTYQMVGLSWPTEINALNQDLIAPRQLKYAIVLKAASNLVESTLPDLADAWHKEALNAEADHRRITRNSQSHNIGRLRPGTTFTQAQQGNLKVGMRFR